MSSLGPKRYDAFLSYNSQDRPAVREVAERLKGGGLELYLETWELRPGEEFQPKLAVALRDSKTCVVFLGPNGLGPWQKQEVQVAVDMRARSDAFHVIPVLLPGAERPRRGDVAHLEFLINASWVEFLKTLDDERAFQSLVWGITGTKPTPTDETRYEGVCPYRGLEAFRTDDARFFFGRENLTDWLVSDLRREIHAPHGVRLLAVLGPSGSGKSSVVLAGLIPRVNAGAIDGSEQWKTAVVRPGDDPLANLVVEVSAPFLPKGAVPDVGQARKLIEDLQGDDRGLDLFARLALRDAPGEARLLVVVDQFEEVFTYRLQDEQAKARFEKARAAFFANLLHAAAASGGRVAVVLTMRSDFLGPCASFERLNNVLNAHLIQVGPMREDELRAAIELPAFKVGCELEPGLTERLLADVEGQAGALPLLQFTLKELWTKRDVRRLTHATYRAMDGVRGAIERRADEIYRSFNPEEQGICRRIFLHLVQLDEGTGDTKRRVSYRELLPQDPERAEAVRKVLLRLADPKARLITTTGADVPEAEGSVEVAHEALIRHWSEFRKWIDAEKEFLRSQEGLRASARRWKEKDRRRDLLLPEGLPLAEAEDLLLCHESELDPDGIEYARASITGNNRRGIFIWILLCMFVSTSSIIVAIYELTSIESNRAAFNKRYSLNVTKLDVIAGSILGIPAAVVPLWVTYRKWRGRPEFETIYLDKAIWATNFTLSLTIIIFTIILISFESATLVMLIYVVPYIVWAMVAAAQLWKKARVQRYYRRRREGLCTFQTARTRLSLMSKAGLIFVLFVGAVMSSISPFLVPGALERDLTRQLYQAHRDIADYQVRDGQLDGAQDSLNRALNLAHPEKLAPRSEAEGTASWRRHVETLAQMGMVLRLAGKPQEAERRFREALEIIHRPWPGYDEVVTTGKSIDYFGGPPKSLEQAIEYNMRLPLLILASKMGAAPTVAQILGNGADVETRAEDGSTALMMAALHGHTQVIKTLLEKGAEVNATGRSGGTALMAAAFAGHADVVKQLLAAGSDRWLRRWNGETAATLASFQGHKDVLASLFGVESFGIELIHGKETEPGGKDAGRLADALVCAGDLARRSGDFGKAASLYRQALEAIPERDDATPQRLPVLVRFSYAKWAAKEYEVAVQYMERAIAVSEALAKWYPETVLVRQEIAFLYGQLAMCELFCKRPQRAIAAARTALELDASQVWIKAMLAHGLLLAGQFDEAKNLYLENRSVRLGNGQSFASAVLRSFGELRANGISHPDMVRIEKLLRTGNGARDVK